MESGLSATFKNLFSLILFLLGIGIGVYLVAILSKVNRIMGKTTDMIEDNIEELDATIKIRQGKLILSHHQ